MRSQVPPFNDFVSRRYASASPFWTWTVFQPVGGALAYCFARLGVSPAAVTLCGGAAGIGGAVLLGLASTPAQVLGAGFLLLLAYSFDCADGQVARATRRASASGAWMDVASDMIVIAFVAAALTYALAQGVSPPLGLVLGGAFGATRTVSLFTSTMVRQSKGGLRLSGRLRHLRTAFIAPIDTPFVYLALCATRLAPTFLAGVVLAVAALTMVQTLVSAWRHFAAGRSSA
jgi:phosphatidylglycerophosphate synthase